jgi:hypothetical protein
LQCSAAVASAVLPETNPEAAAAIPEVAAAIPEVALLPVRDLTLGEREEGAMLCFTSKRKLLK